MTAKRVLDEYEQEIRDESPTLVETITNCETGEVVEVLLDAKAFDEHVEKVAERRAQGEWDLIRAERDARLAGSDWTQLADSPVDMAAWAAYRQALRDLPAQSDDPRMIVFPVVPS